MANFIDKFTPVNQNVELPKAAPQNQAIPSVEVKQPTEESSNLLQQYLNQSGINASVAINKTNETPAHQRTGWDNHLRTTFQNNQAVIMGVIPRSFNAKNVEGNQLIRGNKDQKGTFINAIERLDELNKLGINTIHMLPIHPPGKENAFGTAGSLYSPADFLKIDPELADPKDPRPIEEQLKTFIDEAHKRGISVMLDLPSCASFDLFKERPDLMAFERNGVPKTPGGWNDIRMFNPWKDETKKELNPGLVDLHKKYVDMCLDLGFDGIRADVSRTKPTQFWDIIIPYSRSKDPEFAWLAESYTYEDASPQINMNYDRPEDALKAGFDSYYGQYHIFHEWTKANQIYDYVKQNLEMSKELEKGKSLIGSFGTHDDISLMFNGGPNFINLVSGMQATLPMLNPYMMDGYQTGDNYLYDFEGTTDPETKTDNHECTVHHGRPDIFNASRPLIGNHPEVGDFFKSAMEMRKKYEDVITKGSFIPLKTDNPDDRVVAFVRHLNGKTLLVVANRDIDKKQSAVIQIPGLKDTENLVNQLPNYGDPSTVQADNDKLRVDLGSSRIHVFEINTPDIESSGLEVLKQNL